MTSCGGKYEKQFPGGRLYQPCLCRKGVRGSDPSLLDGAAFQPGLVFMEDGIIAGKLWRCAFIAPYMVLSLHVSMRSIMICRKSYWCDQPG